MRYKSIVLLALVLIVALVVAACEGGGTAGDGEDRGTGSQRKDPTGPSPFTQQAGADFVGSGECAECHDQVYAQWFGTGHAQIIQDVEDNPRAIKGDFASESTTRTFDAEGIILTHGVQWKQRYINSDWQILPAQWNFDSRTWAPYNVDTWEEVDWRKECAFCHTVGYDLEKNQWQELGIGCEACHGPGSAHAENPTLGNIMSPRRMTRTLAGDLCGICHTRGKSPDGERPHPVDVLPGDMITPSNFVPVSYETTKSWWPDGSVREHRQQWIQWKETRHYLGGVDCSACHTVHQQATKFATRAQPNVLCRECHPDVSTDSVSGHAPIAGAPQHSNCVGCHMPPSGKSADFGDEHDHRFTVIKPQVTIELGGGDPAKQPNSCNLCHYHEDDDPEDLQLALDRGRSALSDRQR
jgi:predicted CXXCH cytochrome family protein